MLVSWKLKEEEQVPEAGRVEGKEEFGGKAREYVGTESF